MDYFNHHVLNYIFQEFGRRKYHRVILGAKIVNVSEHVMERFCTLAGRHVHHIECQHSIPGLNERAARA